MLGSVSTAKIILLVLVFFATSLVSVVTGSTSLITVPALIEFGVEPHVAVATNMLALLFMSIGGSFPLVRKGLLVPRRLPILIAVTIVGSALGGVLVLQVPVPAFKLIIAIAMIVVAIFSLRKQSTSLVSESKANAGYMVGFFLAIYGGFFSGGYVTLLTASFLFFFGMTLLEAIAMSKVINIFSCAAAILVFASRHMVNYRLGLLLGIAMFAGGIIGGHITTKVNPIWLRRFFVLVVLTLAAKMLADFAIGAH
jgi:uncharacterized protein